MSCGICLSKLKEPVSVPCGHVYCTECLTGHVSATSADGFTSNCPTCRETFNMVRPELTCLPKKFHQYIVPSIRRVYIDMSRHEGLRKKLSASEVRVKALEKDKERLMAECERHIAAARAHSQGETDAILKAKDIEEELEETRENAVVDMQEAEQALRAMKLKYDKMKRHCRALEASGVVEDSPLAGKRNSSLVDLSVDEAASPKRLRVIRPLPRSRQSLQTPVSANTLYSRLYAEGEPCGLGSPFRS
ncbi:hypothetical protein C8R44DRAFT_879344 [Mycena epipterygia]|nr:hypothetical protein C8R44DRAFT_879344 [Mycena epipterygia]